MSERVSPSLGRPEPVTLESGLEALQTGQEFRGPVEELDGHHCNDHFAQIYETAEERFAAAVPFVRHGLEGGERVMYVVDESSEAEVQAILRDAGVDVDTALDSGALSFHTVQETYLRNGSFAPDEMIDFYGEAVSAATEEYEALRIVAETTWLQDEGTTVEQFMEYEAKVNDLFADEDCLALCQYDRDGFPPEVVENIVQTHPHLIYDGAVCHNFYYTPPEEFFGADDPSRTVDRMLGTLRERTEAKSDLAEHKQFLRELSEITASRDLSFEEKLHALFDLGCEWFDLDFGFLNRVDPAADHLEIEHASSDHEHYKVGGELPLSETYCKAAVDIKAAASIADPAKEGFDDIFVYEEFGVEGYLGTYIPVDGGVDRTLAFVPAADSQSVSVSEEDRTYLELMGQWIGYELNRRQRERFLRECYEITSDPARGFEEKIEHLLDLGREWFGLDMAGLHHLPSWDGKFRLEKGVGLGVDPEDEPLITDPGDGAYCREAVTADAPVGMSDVRGTDWEDDQIYEDLGVTSYLGTTVSGGCTPYGTLWFGSTEPRNRSFSDTERTFIELMGQWIGYELNRRQRERFLRECYEITSDPGRGFEEKLHSLFDLGCERFGLEIGGLAKVDPDTDLFEVEVVNGDHEYLEPGARADLSETYCRLVTDDGETTAVTDPVDAGFEGNRCYEQFGVRAYLGTHLEIDGGTDRTFWFVSTEPRENPVTDEERTFIHLMGQWVKYELERNHREAQLERKNDRLESFASMLAHELRNPVTIGQIYGQQLPDETDAEAVEYVTEAFDRIEDMIDVMLVLTRGREAVGERTPVSLASVARDVWDDMDTPDATFDVTLDRTIQADETYVRHLFRNLFENSIEHGGEDVSITVGESSTGFYVADDGPGIPENEREAVFETGYTTTADTGGTGLGLAFVQKLAEVYEWDYEVTESADGGARFEFHVA